ncbi:MAG TPA: DUF5694 domain-containing protein [Caulobacterales bacterium]|nr:DUF5694 domain-containing protein [Caulobacterales bacterium]
MRSILASFTFFLALLAAAAPALAQRAFDPRTYQERHVGAATQILVLGTPHLSATPETFDPAVLEPLLARLAAFRPDAIAIEALPGRSIAQMWQYREAYPRVAHDYGGRAMLMAALARASTDLDMPDAEAELRRALAGWPASPAPAQRRRLAALFAASGDPASALTQWWRLAPEERIADDNVRQNLVDLFASYETPARRNENYLIATRLAVRLGLERIFPMDDQSDDLSFDPEFAANMDRFTDEPWFAAMLADPRIAPMREAPQRLTTPDQALATYRFLNSAGAGRADADAQWLNMITRQSPGDAGRERVAAWETRNLRMAANIREAAALYPGGRVLVIVGSAHKPWLDAYLSMMSDVRIADASAVLR